MPDIALIGPGAIGGTLAAWLATQSDNELTICARTPFETLVVDSPFRVIESRPKMLTEPNQAKPVDWILIATKTYHMASVAKWLPALLGSETKVAVIQNGVEHLANLKSLVSEDRIVPVIIDCPAERFEPGRILQRAAIKMTVPNSAYSERFAALFPNDNITILLTNDWTTAAWKKLCINSGGAVSALLNEPANVVRERNAAEVMRGLIRECIAVARAEGAVIKDSVIEEIVASQADAPDGAMNSIHADLVEKRPMEWDARNGVIVRLGKRHGVPTPFNEMAVNLLRALEAKNASS